MIAKQLLQICSIYRLHKLVHPTGTIFFIESLYGAVWKRIYSTADTGLLADRIIKLGIANDHPQALRLLNR